MILAGAAPAAGAAASSDPPPPSPITSEYIEMDNSVNAEDKVEEPKIGMMFDTVEEVKEYYRKYGNEMGFSVKNRTSRRDDDLQIIYVVFSCSLAGKADPTRKVRWRPSSRTDCKAKLSVALCPDGKWKVTIIKLEHNHALSPGDSRLLKWGRKKIVDKKSELTEKVRRLQLGQGDASRIQDYFMKMQANNSNFFYMMDLDDEGYLRNIFWSDAKSRAAYDEFGDAVTFDTSYLTSKYELPFAPFLGVNHHGQLTLLGCALLSSETTETFSWLFRCFLACMSGCAPKTIITDQGTPMQNAVELVFPNTRHRWCLYQIIKKLPAKLRGSKQYDSIKSEIQNVVYDSVTCHEFEECWNIMIEKYKLQSNEWLLGLYDERHRWVPTFLKDTFDAMFKGQRSENMVAFFDGYINSKTTLQQFVEQYVNAMRKKMQKEKQEDYNSSHLVIPCITHYAMEKQFQDAYTSTIFKEFQQELRGKMYCDMASVKKDVVCSEYEISEDMTVGEVEKSGNFKVSLKHNDCDIHCSCCLFESKGILCRHAIVVLIHNKILTVPEKYIIRRWRKDLRRRHTKPKFHFDEFNGKPEACRFDKMSNIFSEIADLAVDFEDKTQLVMDWINEMVNELRRDEGYWASQSAITMHDGATTTGDEILPIEPPYKRKASKGDTVVRKNKAKQKRMEPRRKINADDNSMQEFQIIEGEEVGYADGAIFGAQDNIVFQDPGFRSHGMHIGGSNDALPTLNFADANLTLWGVPQSGQPNLMQGNMFVPPKFAYGRGG